MKKILARLKAWMTRAQSYWHVRDWLAHSAGAWRMSDEAQVRRRSATTRPWWTPGFFTEGHFLTMLWVLAP